MEIKELKGCMKKKKTNAEYLNYAHSCFFFIVVWKKHKMQHQFTSALPDFLYQN